MTPEERALAALDDLRDALGAVFAQRRVQADPPALLTISAAAERLGISRATATRWADSGRLPTVGARKSRRVPLAAINELAQAPPPGAA